MGGAAGPGGGWGRLAGRSAMAGALLLVAGLSLTRVTDTDLWWHLATGDLILQTGAVPRAEPFSYSAPGVPWIDIHWLFQVAAAFLFRRGGLAALTFAKVALVIILFGWLAARGRRLAGPNAVAAVLMLAAITCHERFHMRPEIVSWLLLAAAIGLVEESLAAPDAARRRRLLFIGMPLVQIVWVNVQGLFVLGLAVLGLGLLASLARLVRAPATLRDTRDPIDRLVALACASLVCLLNPFGVAALRLPFEQLFGHLGGRSLLSRTIAEFQPPFSGEPVTPAIIAFGLLAGVTLLSLVLNAGRLRAFDLLLTLAMLWLALQARRNIPLFVIAAAPVLLRNGAEAGRALLAHHVSGWEARHGTAPGHGRAARGMALALAALSLILLVEVVSNRFFLLRPTEQWWGLGTIPWYFPEDAARAVNGAQVQGQVFHSLASGGFLIHAWHGERRVFIDGRNDPYLDGILASYLEAIADPAAFEKLVRRYRIGAVLWSHQRAVEGRALIGHLARDPRWRRIHLDPAAVVYARVDPTLDALPTGVTGGAPAGDRSAVYGELARRLEERPFAGPPIRDIALAEYFNVAGEPEGAELFYRRALIALPRRAMLLYGLALALERQGKDQAARTVHEEALRRAPGFAPSLVARGSWRLQEGRLKEAAGDLDRAWRQGDRSVRLVSSPARLMERRGDMPGAVAAYREALGLHPRSTVLLGELAIFYERHGEAATALTFLQAAGAIDQDDPGLTLETVLLMERLGRASAALETAREGAWRSQTRVREGSEVRGDRDLLRAAARLELRFGNLDRAEAWNEVLSQAVRRGETPRAGP